MVERPIGEGLHRVRDFMLSFGSSNMEYYFNTHLPLVEKLWGHQGLRSWAVTTGYKDTEYHVQATLVWESIEAFNNVETSEEVMEDIKNFTDVPPYRWVGTVVGQGTIAK